MKVIKQIGLTVLSLALFLIIFVTSAKMAIFSDYTYFQREYEKYEVAEDMDMDMEHIMDVTYEMMDYLDGKRDNLDIITVVDGKEQEFFSEDEKTHMLDVKVIFDTFLLARNIALIYVVIFVIFVIILTYAGKINPRYMVIGVAKNVSIIFGTILAIALFIVVYAIIDFNSAFTIMHEILFSNDLWLMDPNTSLLINMLPEGFFSDMAVRIIIYVMSVFGLVLIASIIIWGIGNKKKIIRISKNVQNDD